MKKLLVALICLFVITPVAAAQAAPDNEQAKEEVVYAKLAADGQSGQVIVVNSFPHPASGQLVDYGDYSEVSNLTNTQPLTSADGKVTGEPNTDNDFYYQGKLNNPQLPWRIAIEYFLGGNPVTAEELLGASGDFEMQLKVTKNPAADPVFFDNYMLQIQVNLPTTRFSDITTDTGSIAVNGDTKVVSFTSLRKQEQSYRLSAKVNDAQLGQIQIVGLPFEMALKLPDLDSYIDQMVQLKNAIAAVADGVNKYTDGAGTLSDGVAKLASGANALQANSQAVVDGFARLQEASQQYQNGLSQYATGSQEFATKLAGLTEAISQLKTGVTQLQTGTQQLADGLASYHSNFTTFNQGLAASAAGAKQLADGINQASQGLAGLAQNGSVGDQSLSASSTKIKQALNQIDQGFQLPMTQAQLDQVAGALEQFTTQFDQVMGAMNPAGIKTMADNLTQISTGLNQLSGMFEAKAAAWTNSEGLASELGVDATNADVAKLLKYLKEQAAELAQVAAQLKTMAGGLNTMATNLQQMAAGMTQLQGSYAQLKQGLTQMKTMLSQFNLSGLEQLKAAISQLNTNYAAFDTGLQAYLAGVNQLHQAFNGDPNTQPPTPGLNAGAKSLSDGLQQLSAAGGQLETGAGQLAEAAKQVNTGVTEFGTGIEQFGTQAGQIVDGANQLASGASQLVSGYQQMLAGQQSFGDGLNSYADGVGKLAGGLNQFATGLGEYRDKGQQLRDGANKLRDETSDMDVKMKEKIDAAMADFWPQDYQLHSFVDARNTGIKQVQFIYIYDGQTTPVAEAEPAPVPPEKSFWQRILDVIFGRK